MPNGAESTSDASELTIELESRGMTRRAGGTLCRACVCHTQNSHSIALARDVLGLSCEGLALSGCTDRSGLDRRRTTWTRAAGGFERIAVEISSDTVKALRTRGERAERSECAARSSDHAGAPRPWENFVFQTLFRTRPDSRSTIYKYIHMCVWSLYAYQ